jgi:hypothetical protein
VIDAAALADPAAGQPPDGLVVGHVDEQDGRELAAELRQRLVERLRLGDRAREPVEQEAVAGLVALHALEDDADDDVVGDELAPVHVLLGLLPELGALRDGGPQHVPGRDVGQVEVLLQALGLGALPGPRGAEQDEVEL